MATEETASVAKNRGETRGLVYVGYLAASAMAAVYLAVLLHEQVPQYGAERWFFGLFWLMFAGGLLLLRWRTGARTLPAAACFAVTGAVWFFFGLPGTGVLIALTVAPALIIERLRLGRRSGTRSQ